MSVVYVLFEYDLTAKHPVGVVSNEAVAEAFYQKDPKNRDWIPFNLDEVPEDTGVPPTPIPPPPQAPMDVEELDATRRRIDETTKNMRDFLEKMRTRTKKRTKK